MYRNGFALLAVVFLLFSGVVFSYSNLGGGWCGCNSCGDCTNALDDNTICGVGVRADGSIMNAGTPICINNPSNLSGGKIFDLNGTILNGIHGATTGIYLHTNADFTIRNGGITGFTDYGMILFNVTYAKVYNMTINDTGPNAGAGLSIGVLANADAYDSHSTIYNCSIVDNGASTFGIWMRYCDENEIYTTDLSRNAHGIWIDCSQDNYIHDSVSDSNTAALSVGFYCISAVDRRSSGNTFLRVNASNNNWAGLIAMRCHNSVVNESRFLSNAVGVGVSLGNEGTNDHEVTVVNNYFNGNNYGIYLDDLDSDPRSGCIFQNNTVRFSTVVGMFFNNTNNNTISSNRVNAGFWGITLQNSQDNNLSGNTIDASTGVGLAVVDTTNTRANNTHFYQNIYDLFVSAPSISQQVYLYNLIFDSNGGYVDYSNVSIVDSLAAGTSYTATWVAAHATPGDTQSFENKFINISNFAGPALSIDQMTWYWSDSELPGYIESQLELWEYSLGTWTVRNATPNLAANTLTIYNHNPGSDYAILQNFSECPVITTAGAYALNASLVGAPNPTAAVNLDYACVVIASDDVYLDCNGYTVTNDGTSDAGGIVTNGTAVYNNITIENCAGISRYEEGVVADSAYDVTIRNVTSFNNTNDGIFAYYVNGSVFENNTAYNNSDGIRCSHCLRANITDSFVFNNTNGIYVLFSNNTRVEDNFAYENEYGILAGTDTFYSNFTSNTAYDNHYGIGVGECGKGDAEYNNLLDNIARDNTVGIYAECASYNTLTNDVAHNNVIGLWLAETTSNTLANEMACNGTVGIFINQTAGDALAGPVMYNNTYDFAAEGSDYTMDGGYFLNPLGTYADYTNLSVVDSPDTATELYSINWTANHYALPGQAISFEEKFVDIETGSGTVSIDEIVWNWAAGEEAGYTPIYFNLLKYNASGWTLVNGTPDTVGRTLSAYAMNPQSEYGILEYMVNTSVLKIDQTVLQPSPGGTVEFNITINNTGNVTLTDSQVIDELPVGLTYLDATPSPDSWAGQAYTWNNVGPLAPGASANIILHAEVDYGVVDAGQIVNLTNYVNTTGTSVFFEEVFAEDYENATIYSANISILKTDVTALPPSPGGIVEYQIDVTNLGNVTLDPVEIVDTLPAEFTYSNADPAPDSTAGPIVWNNVGPIAPGATVIILLNATVNAGTPDGVYTNTADAEGQPPNGDNVTASDDVDVGVFVPAIDVTKVATRNGIPVSTVTVGQKITFTLTITNTGATNLTVWAQDTLPAELAYVAGEADPLPTSVAGQVLYWDAIAAVLEPGQNFDIEYNVSVVSAGVGVQNDVLVTGVPPNGDNVTDTAFVTLGASWPPDDDSLPILEIEVDPDPTYLGDPTTILVTSGGDPVNHATVTVYESGTGHYFEGYTDSDGEMEYYAEATGSHWASAQKSGYLHSGKDYFQVIEPVECMETTDCVELYGECYVCSVHRDAAYNECVLKPGAECGSKDPCKGEDSSTDDIMEPKPECWFEGDMVVCTNGEPKGELGAMVACIECMCEEIACIDEEDCADDEDCVNYECQPSEGCTDDSDCPTGYVCESGECVPGGCTSDSDCPDSQYCDGGQCTDLNCVCGYSLNHACVFYECCSDAVCERMYGIDYFCNLATNECEEEQPPEGNGTLDVDTPDTTPVGEEITINVTSGGEPVPGAEVTIIINGKGYGAGLTDENGQARFTPQEAGQYLVEATKPGYGSGQDDFEASKAGLSLMEIAAIILAPLLLLALLAILYFLFFAKKKKRRFKEDSED